MAHTHATRAFCSAGLGLLAIIAAGCAADAPDVGTTCTPRNIPPNGFEESEVYIDPGMNQCTYQACLVDHLSGDPRTPCKPTATRACADKGEAKKRVYCSCRCDAAASEEERCQCPDGFKCENVLEAIGQSYCTRNGN